VKATQDYCAVVVACVEVDVCRRGAAGVLVAVAVLVASMRTVRVLVAMRPLLSVATAVIGFLRSANKQYRLARNPRETLCYAAQE
jgi:hypothetical protein